MNQRTFKAIAAVVASLGLGASAARAQSVVKVNNTDALNLPSSWTGEATPGAGDVAVWNNTVTGANSTALGGSLSWQGISIADPGGAITIGNAGGLLTLGSGGIDLSAATQNLTLLNSGTATLTIGASQTWNVATGRTLSLFSTSNAVNQAIAGSGNLQITTAGTGVVNVNTGDASTTGFAGSGNSSYSGNWTIGTGTAGTGTLVALRNGANAWGTGTVTLNGGTIASTSGNWTWTNAMVLNSGVASGVRLASGNDRSLKLQGVISGSGGLTIVASGSTQGLADRGIILTGANTMSGTLTIDPNAFLRVGGVGGNDVNLNAGASGNLGAATVVNNGSLTFSRSNAHTVANNISGSGVVYVGGIAGTAGSAFNTGNDIAAASTQVLTLSGANTYTGATTVNAGTLNLSGSLTSSVTVAANAKIGGVGSSTSPLTLAANAGIVLTGGATTAGLTFNGVTLNGAVPITFDTAPVGGTVYKVFTYGEVGISGGENLSVASRGALADDPANQRYLFTAGGPAARTWNTTTGDWENGGASTNWLEGDQKFYAGDAVTFGNVDSDSTVTLAGVIQPASVNVTNAANIYSFGGTAITGSTALTKSGNGTLRLSTQSNYTGGTTVNGGILDLAGGGGASGAIRGTVTVNTGGTLRLSTGDATGYNTDASRISTINLVGGTLHVNTTANQTLGSATVNMTGGSITGIAGSNIDLFANGSAINTLASPTTSTISLPSMNLRQNDSRFTVADGAAAIDLLISSNLGNGSAGNHNLIKSGSGTMALSGANVYNGTTTIEAGMLQVGASNALQAATGNVIVSGGTLSSSVATATLGGNLSLSSAGVVDPNGASIGLFQFAAAKSFSMAGGTLEIDIASASSFDQLVGTATGAFTITGGTLNLAGSTLDYGSTYPLLASFGPSTVSGLNITGYNTAAYTASLSSGGVLSFAAVPEPAGLALVALGAAGLLRRSGRRR